MTEAPEGAAPWLSTTPGEAFREAIEVLNERTVVSRLRAMTDLELIEARQISLDLNRSFTRMANTFDLFAARGQFGFGFLHLVGGGDPLTRAFMFLNAAVVPEAREAAAAFNQATGEFEALTLLGR